MPPSVSGRALLFPALSLCCRRSTADQSSDSQPGCFQRFTETRPGPAATAPATCCSTWTTLLVSSLADLVSAFQLCVGGRPAAAPWGLVRGCCSSVRLLVLLAAPVAAAGSRCRATVPHHGLIRLRRAASVTAPIVPAGVATRVPSRPATSRLPAPAVGAASSATLADLVQGSEVQQPRTRTRPWGTAAAAGCP